MRLSRTSQAIVVTILAGAALVAGPAASGAPGESGCIEAEARLRTGFESSGLDEPGLDRLRITNLSLANARNDWSGLALAIGAAQLQAVDEARRQLDQAGSDVTTALADLAVADNAGDEEGISSAQLRLADAEHARLRAEEHFSAAEKAYAQAIDVPEMAPAQARLDSAQALHDAELAAAGVEQFELYALLEWKSQVLQACDPSNVDEPVTDPVEGPVDEPVDGSVDQPTEDQEPWSKPDVLSVPPGAPPVVGTNTAEALGAGAQPDPIAVNTGLNIQTSLAAVGS